jgi:two-component system chemotaxis response regulator CheB
VDDSAVMRSLLRSAIASDGSLEVVGTAVDGRAALAAAQDLRPDLIMLDVAMPVLDGLRALRSLRERMPAVPVIMCSALTHRGARVTLEALAAGASDYVTKPSGQPDAPTAIRALAAELVPKIHALTVACPAVTPTPPAALPVVPRTSAPSVVVVGVSTGGPAALEVLLAGLPADFPLPVLVAQHMPEFFTQPLAERLNARCAVRVREAADGDFIGAGALIARGDWHLEAVALPEDRRARVRLSRWEPQNHCRPSVDVLFQSATAVYGAGVVAVVLTGMGSDGLAGAHAVRDAGGIVFAQDQATSAVWGMPGAVARAGLAHRVLPLGAIAGDLLRLARVIRKVEDAEKKSVQVVS